MAPVFLTLRPFKVSLSWIARLVALLALASATFSIIYCNGNAGSALSYWVDLGKKYPPALEKLKEIRSEKENAIKRGSTSFELFHDVSSINRALGEDQRSLKLFKEIEARDAAHSKRLWIISKDLAFQYKDYELINRYISDVTLEYSNVYADYLRDFTMFKEQAHITWVKTQFIAETNQLVELARFNGDEATAKKIKARVAKVLKSDDGIID